MTERFELRINDNGQVDIIDWLESRQKDAICIYNDLGVLPYSSAKAVCELLNNLHEEKEYYKRELQKELVCQAGRKRNDWDIFYRTNVAEKI